MRASEPTLPDARGSSYSARSLTVAACAVKGVVVPVGARPTPAVIVATGKAVEVVPEVTKDKSLRCPRAASGSSASQRALTGVNVEQAPKTLVAEADPPPERGRPTP